MSIFVDSVLTNVNFLSITCLHVSMDTCHPGSPGEGQGAAGNAVGVKKGLQRRKKALKDMLKSGGNKV